MACIDADSCCKTYRNEIAGKKKSMSASSSSPRLLKSTMEEMALHMNAVDDAPRMHRDFKGGDNMTRTSQPQDHEFQECVALVNLLKAYSYQKDLVKGSKLHADILKRGLLRKDRYLGTAILRMYVKCGALGKAREVFDELPLLDMSSWTVLIAGYTEQGLSDIALEMFRRMKDEGFSPDSVTYICVLKACSSIKALDEGEEIHVEVSRKALLKNNIVLATALVDMYGKCGSPAKAREVFDQLPGRDLALWTALIAGYTQHGHGSEALSCYAQMLNEGFVPNAVTFVCILKACASIRAIGRGEEICLELRRLGFLESNTAIGNALVDMYFKCGLLEKAQEVFDELPQRNLATWSALICGYIEQGLGEKALYLFGCMRDGGIIPDSVLFARILRACGDTGTAEEGERVYADAQRWGFLPEHDVLGRALVYMYSKCDMLNKAQKILLELSIEDISSWNTLMAGYVRHGLNKEALNCYEYMQCKGLSPNAVTFICYLRACSSLGALDKGEAIHAEVSRQGLLEQHIELGNTLVDMYAKCGVTAKAQKVFDKLPSQDVVSWTSLINGYAKHGTIDETLCCLKQMCKAGISPDAATFICILKACGRMRAVEKGKEIHDEARRLGLLENHAIINTAVVDMYAKCGTLVRAQEAFDESPVHDVVSWTALIAGYVESGFGNEATKFFKRMQEEGALPDAATFTCIVKACGIIREIEMGEEIHAQISGHDLLGMHVDLGNALVGMYAKCGLMARAQELFDSLPLWCAISWTVLISGYAENGFDDEALICFEKMVIEGFLPDVATFICMLKVCGNLGLVEKGGELLAIVYRQGLLGSHMLVSTALLDMYAKCGVLSRAQEVFDNLSERNVVSWTALMSVYTHMGKVDEVISSFKNMLEDSVDPNMVTFQVLLTACSHAGLVEKGHSYFVMMSTTYRLFPMLEHYHSMVHLFSRAGCFDESICIIKEGLYSGCILLWLALLGACQNWVILELGRWAFEHAIKLSGALHSAAYACMRNIYAAAGMREEAEKLEALRLNVVYSMVENNS